MIVCQVCVGFLVPGGAADSEGLLKIGDVISAVNGECVLGASHHDVVRFISESASQRGHVTLTVHSHLDLAPSGDSEWYQAGALTMMISGGLQLEEIVHSTLSLLLFIVDSC